MEGKKWYRSKAVLTAIITALLGGLEAVSTALGHPIQVPQWIYTTLAGLGLYALRAGVGKPLS